MSTSNIHSAMSGLAAPEPAAVACTDGLDGAERKALLHHIARAWPEVVAAGAKLVAQRRADCSESRRQNQRRKEHDRRKRRRAKPVKNG